jgi:hypothetical protein
VRYRGVSRHTSLLPGLARMKRAVTA